MFHPIVGDPSIYEKRAAWRLLNEQRFAEEMAAGEIDLGADVHEALYNKNWRLGCATAYVVDLVVREVPPRPRSLAKSILSFGIGGNVPWPEGMHAVAAQLDLEKPDDSEDVRTRLLIAQKVFRQTDKTKVHESRLPFIGPRFRNKEIFQINPGYRTLARCLRPTHLLEPALREGYISGFDEGAAEIGLTGLTLAHGKEILRRAPRKIRVLPIDVTDTEVRALSEFGIRLTWPKPEVPKDTTEAIQKAELSRLTLEAYRPSDMPFDISAASVWKRTRAQQAAPPKTHETHTLYEEILAGLTREVDATSYF